MKTKNILKPLILLYFVKKVSFNYLSNIMLQLKLYINIVYLYKKKKINYIFKNFFFVNVLYYNNINNKNLILTRNVVYSLIQLNKLNIIKKKFFVIFFILIKFFKLFN